ncbi:MAG: hypothetical protein IKS19_04430 [Clostridia bacterium]|nr:hypothetical protein [Clostridia bacterium]
MGKVFQHFYSSTADGSGTVAYSAELGESICTHLEKTVCALKCFGKGEAFYATPLTSDAIVIGKCTCSDEKESSAFYHNYIISNADAAKIINDDPFYFTSIKFSSSPEKEFNAGSLDFMPMSDKKTSRAAKISGIMLQNAYCTFMDIASNGKMKYLNADEGFLPTEIVGMAYSVLPIHLALRLSFTTFSDSVPAIKYNLCYVGKNIFQSISPLNKISSAALFSSEQPISIAAFPRMSRLLEQSSISLDEITSYHRFAYDLINVVNKHSGNQLDIYQPELYEAVLCIFAYVNNYAAARKNELPDDIKSAVDWLDNTVQVLPEMEPEIRRLVPKNEIIESEKKDKEVFRAKRVEREMATKIIGLISAKPDDFKSFLAIKYQVMREARMETISLELFQDILRKSLISMFQNEMDDSRITMAGMAISLAFEVVDYRVYGAECISYSPYDYDGMLEFVLSLPCDSRIMYNEIMSLHKKADLLAIVSANHKKPSRRKKSKKGDQDLVSLPEDTAEEKDEAEEETAEDYADSFDDNFDDDAGEDDSGHDETSLDEYEEGPEDDSGEDLPYFGSTPTVFGASGYNADYGAEQSDLTDSFDPQADRYEDEYEEGGDYLSDLDEEIPSEEETMKIGKAEKKGFFGFGRKKK